MLGELEEQQGGFVARSGEQGDSNRRKGKKGEDNGQNQVSLQATEGPLAFTLNVRASP